MSVLKEEQVAYITNAESEEQEIEFKNPIKEVGFAQIHHIITLDNRLSDGAYRTYALLHFYWQQKDYAFPSIKTMSKLRGYKDTTIISRHLAELIEVGLITRGRRFGTSSMTYLEDLPQEYVDAAVEVLKARKETKRLRAANIAKMQSLQKCNVEPCKNATLRITIEEEQDSIFGDSSPPKTQNLPRTKEEIKQGVIDAMDKFSKSGGKKRGIADPNLARTDRKNQIAEIFYNAMDGRIDERSAIDVAKKVIEEPYDIDWIERTVALMKQRGETKRDTFKVYYFPKELQQLWAEKVNAEEKIWVFSN